MRRALLWMLVIVIGLGALAGWLAWAPARASAFRPFPPERECAVAILDEADGSRMEAVGSVYALLDSLGLRVTKGVRVLGPGSGDPEAAGLSLDDAAYRAWVQGEAAAGHEIALLWPSRGHDDRAIVQRARKRFVAVLGRHPRIGVSSRDDGRAGIGRDIVRYAPTYTTDGLNTLALNPSMPYEDPRAPRAALGFAGGDARSAERFVRLLAPPSIERLKSGRGVAVVRTRFANGFTRGGSADGRLEGDEAGAGSPEPEPRDDGSRAAGSGGPPAVRGDVREALSRCGTDRAIEILPVGELLDRLRAIQVIEDALAAGRGGHRGAMKAEPTGRQGRDLRISIPRALLPALHEISVEPARLPPHLRARFEGGEERMRLLDWLGRARIVTDIAPSTVFEGARRAGWRERWRLEIR